MKKEVVKVEEQKLPVELKGGKKLDGALKFAQELSKSDLIPKEYQNKPANCLIAIELADRLGASPVMVMQNTDVIYGKPALRSSFIIACINNSGKIKGSLKFEMDAAKTKCRAWATEKGTGEKLTGPTVTLEMAQSEGWLTKSGSKWKTMPELMLRYRAAAFFGRLYCPEVMNGMYSADEARDISESVTPQVVDVFAEDVKTEKQENKPLLEDKKENQEVINIGDVSQEDIDKANAFYEAMENEVNG